MASFNVTRRALSLGARDAITGWPIKSYAETTIKGSFDPLVGRQVALNSGLALNSIPYSQSPFYTGNLVQRGDRIVNANGDEFELTWVKPVFYGDQFVMYVCNAAEIIAPVDRAASSGMWHTDSDAVKTDPRNRIKTWLDSYLSYAVCDYQTMFSGLDYPLEREFTLNGLEIVCAIDIGQSTPEYTYDHKPYKFTETVTITNTAMDTDTLTAANILESFEQAIRKVATDHPLGSIRRIRSTSPSRVDVGGAWLWQNTITIEYIRANDEYTPSYPRITWGPSASPSGTFTFPNVTRISIPNVNADILLHSPSRIGAIMQALGTEGIEIQLTCDLDVSPSGFSWKRPQTTSPKSDGTNFDVFLDIMHNACINQPYQTLSFGWGSLQVRLERMEPALEGDGNMVTLTFREYRATSASTLTYKQRFGIS